MSRILNHLYDMLKNRVEYELKEYGEYYTFNFLTDIIKEKQNDIVKEDNKSFLEDSDSMHHNQLTVDHDFCKSRIVFLNSNLNFSYSAKLEDSLKCLDETIKEYECDIKDVSYHARIRTDYNKKRFSKNAKISHIADLGFTDKFSEDYIALRRTIDSIMDLKMELYFLMER